MKLSMEIFVSSTINEGCKLYKIPCLIGGAAIGD